MMSQNPELDAIRQRLEKLERENRRLKRAGTLGLLVVGAAFLMAQGKYNRRVDAEEFVITDAHGSERAELAWKDQAPRFVLLDAHGKPQPAPGATLLAANAGAEVGTSEFPQGAITRKTAIRELPSVDSAARPAMKRPRTERHNLADLPGASGLAMVASLGAPSTPSADAGFEAPSTEWDADAASLSVSNRPQPAATTSSTHADQIVTLPPLGARPSHPSSIPAMDDCRLPGERSAPGCTAPAIAGRQSATGNQKAGGPLAQLEKPLDAAASWPPTSVASVAPADAPVPGALDAGPAVLPPPLALKVMGYADKPGKGRELFIAEDSEVFVVHEGDLFADRFRVLKISPTEVELEDVTRRERFKLTFHP